jgi:hypothetical protein
MNHIANRSLIVDALCEELVGPSPQGRAISCAGHVSFSSNEAFYGPWRQENGEEILQRDPPIVRYGVGVLYPMKSEFEKEETAPEEGAPVVDEGRDTLLEQEKLCWRWKLRGVHRRQEGAFFSFVSIAFWGKCSRAKPRLCLA